MATKGRTLPPCDLEVFENGAEVFRTDTIPSNAMARWVRSVAELSGQRVDWHFVGGRARVVALGDLDKVRGAIHQLMPEHDRLRRKRLKKMRLGSPV